MNLNDNLNMYYNKLKWIVWIEMTLNEITWMMIKVMTWMNNDKHETKTLARIKMYHELGQKQGFMDQTKGMTKDLSESDQMKLTYASYELGTRYKDDPDERQWKKRGKMKVVGLRN